jgi:hypothetical protein
METKEVAAPLPEAQEFNAKLADFLAENFIMGGRTMTDWKRHLYIKIPEEVTYPVLIKLAREVTEKYQEAAKYRDEQTVQLAILEQTKGGRYNEAYTKARRESEEKFRKPLAADSCKVAAALAVKDIEDAISHQKVVKDFWRDSCATLVEVRKHIEIMARALSGDAFAQRDMVIKDSKSG